MLFCGKFIVPGGGKVMVHGTIRAFFLPAKCAVGGLLGLHHWLSVVIGDTVMSALFGQEASSRPCVWGNDGSKRVMV